MAYEHPETTHRRGVAGAAFVGLLSFPVLLLFGVSWPVAGLVAILSATALATLRHRRPGWFAETGYRHGWTSSSAARVAQAKAKALSAHDRGALGR